MAKQKEPKKETPRKRLQEQKQKELKRKKRAPLATRKTRTKRPRAGQLGKSYSKEAKELFAQAVSLLSLNDGLSMRQADTKVRSIIKRERQKHGRKTNLKFSLLELKELTDNILRGSENERDYITQAELAKLRYLDILDLINQNAIFLVERFQDISFLHRIEDAVMKALEELPPDKAIDLFTSRNLVRLQDYDFLYAADESERESYAESIYNEVMRLIAAYGIEE